MTINDAIKFLDKKIVDPNKGLPEEIFYFISRNTPMINVDLLIKDDLGRTLLAWRKDKFIESGWHIPGGIIRYKEKIVDRIKKVAENEIGVGVKFDPEPIAINELIVDNIPVRGHFISLLFNCRLLGKIETGSITEEKKNGKLAWFDKSPDDLISVHSIYKKFINNNSIILNCK